MWINAVLWQFWTLEVHKRFFSKLKVRREAKNAAKEFERQRHKT